MEPPNDTSSVANMSVMTVTGEIDENLLGFCYILYIMVIVKPLAAFQLNIIVSYVTGTVFGPGMEAAKHSKQVTSNPAGARGGLMDYFATQSTNQHQYNESDEENRGSTKESDIM